MVRPHLINSGAALGKIANGLIAGASACKC